MNLESKRTNPIYLDHHATTPLDPKVLEAMIPYFTTKFGNPASTDHTYGSEASVAIEKAREQVGASIGVPSDRQHDIIFTSGATESNNLAIQGVMNRYKDKGNHLITCVSEHDAILNTTKYLENIGKKVTYLPVDNNGNISLEQLKESITNETIMVSIMTANNEVGTIHNIKEIGSITRDSDIIFHTDAAQATGYIPINVNDCNIDLLSMSGHKMYGPKGIGALYARGVSPRVRPEPLVHGGGQERGMRSGTLNVPAIVGLGHAAQIAVQQMKKQTAKLLKQTKAMQKKLEDIGGVINGNPENKLPHNINMYFSGIEGKAIINSVSTYVAISAGSACTTQSVKPSHNLIAMGYDESRAHSSIRIGLGRFTSDEDVKVASEHIVKAVEHIRNSMKI